MRSRAIVKRFRSTPSAGWWRYAWIVLAVASAIPAAIAAYGRLKEVTHHARETLIVQHRLWELHPEYYGTPEAWTRFASRLLSDRQLLRRVRAKYGDLGIQVELDYRRDLAISQAEVVIVAGAIWAAPLAALYGLGVVLVRLRGRAPPAPAPRHASYDDPRYRS
jgi:hypothetical protein